MVLLDLYLAYSQALLDYKDGKRAEQRELERERQQREHRQEQHDFLREFVQLVGVKLRAKLEEDRAARALSSPVAQKVPPSPKEVLINRADRLVEISRAVKDLQARYAGDMNDDPDLREALTRLLEASRIELMDPQEVA